MAVTQPVWSLIDEAQHADFIVQLSHGIYPIADKTIVDSETLRLMQSTGVFGFWPAPGTYALPDVTDIGTPPPGMSPRANAVWMSRHLWQLSYESQQTPGYYVLMVPIWWVADGLGGTLAAVYVMRIVNALLIALLAPLAVVVARRLAPGRTEIAALAALFAILLPGLALNGTRVSNDGLAAVLGGAAIALGTTWVGAIWTVRRALWLGLVLGVGVLAKLSLIGLAPALALALLWPARGTSWSRRLAIAFVAGAVVAICLGIWFAINLHLYGVPIPSARASRLSIVQPMQYKSTYVPVALFLLVESYWSGEPFGTLPFSLGFAALGALVTLVAIAGLVRLYRTRRRELVSGPVAVGLTAVAGTMAFALLLPVVAHFQFVSPGRYLYPAVPAAAALCALGLCTALSRPLARCALGGLYGLAGVVILGGGALGLGGEPTQSGPGTPPAGVRTVSTDATGQLGGVVIQVDQLALDTANRSTWIHVTAANNGSSEAEWTVAPIVSVAGSIAVGDYSRSTHLPGDVEAGQTLTGWLFVALDPRDLQPGQLVLVRFPDIATDGYREVGDISIQVPLTRLMGN